MRQTDSAMRMLISAYKAVLANCYIKETLAGRVKRFCKGVALSSFLTAVLAVSSQSAVAGTPINNTITSNSDLDGYSSGNITVTSGKHAINAGSFIEKDPAIRNKGSVDIFSGSFNFQTVNP